jgi:cytochrome P450
MRTATEDFDIRDKTIKAGEAVCLHYPSGNRDEEVFEAPFEFRVDRDVKRQVAFGYGAHVCLGMHLARMEIRALFAELLPRLDEIALTGAPRKTRSNFVSGLKTLPVRYRMR